MKTLSITRSAIPLVCLAAVLAIMAPLQADAQVKKSQPASAGSSSASTASPVGMRIQFDTGQSRSEVSNSIKILLMMTALALAPSAIVMTTSFMRILIVFGFLRQAMGTMQTPPGQILAAMSMFLSIFIMMPVWQKINTDAMQPYLAEKISGQEAWDKGIAPLRKFMGAQTGEKELSLFIELSGKEMPKSIDDVPLETMVPAFMISELKTAFLMGVLIYLPFLVIDLVIATSLMSLGMMMLPPMMISLPIKLLFFVLADGWTLVIRGIVSSFKMGG